MSLAAPGSETPGGTFLKGMAIAELTSRDKPKTTAHDFLISADILSPTHNGSACLASSGSPRGFTHRGHFLLPRSPPLPRPMLESQPGLVRQPPTSIDLSIDLQ
jgi:hypothetical protein